MRLHKKVFALFLAAILTVGTMGLPTFATEEAETVPCYLYEDFEAEDFANTAADTTVPYHENGSSEKLDLYYPGQSYGIKFSVESETDEAGNENHYLLYHSPGGSGWRSTGLRLASDNVKNSSAPIYEYTVSYDIKVDDWAHLNADDTVKNHSSRLLSIWHGDETTAASARLEEGYLRIIPGIGANTGVEIDGVMQDYTQNYAEMWDTANGIGEMHNFRWVYSVGENGEGVVDVFVDGICVANNAVYAEQASALPSNGIYFGVAAYNSAGGKHRCKIRFDNIRLEYEGAPLSENETEKPIQVLNGRIATHETKQADANYTLEHTFSYNAVNNTTSDEELFVIAARYDEDGRMENCKVEKHTVAAGERYAGTVNKTDMIDVDTTEDYKLKCYVYNEDLVPQCDAVVMDKNPLELALMGLEALYDTETMLDWLTSLYDTETGGMYYATSSKNNPHMFGPHIESTFGGMYGAIPYLDPEPKAALGRWIQSCQDEATGYFIEKEFNLATASEGKKGRDLGYAKGILSRTGVSALYPTADQRAVATAEVDEPSLMAYDDTVAGSLSSQEDWLGYLNSRNWTEGYVWNTCHILESNLGLITNAGYKKITAEFIANLVHPETGMVCGKKQYNMSTQSYEWVADEVASYYTVSGTLKALWAYGADSIPYPYVDKLFENALTLAKTDEPSDMSQIANLPIGLQGARDSYAAAGVPLPDSVNKTLKEITPGLIRELTRQLSAYKKPDGCFGYRKDGGQAYSQGAHVSLGLNESDINGNNALATRVRVVLYDFAEKWPVDILPMDKLAAKLNAKWRAAHAETRQDVQSLSWTEDALPVTDWELSDELN